jgi:hypothetical protein
LSVFKFNTTNADQMAQVIAIPPTVTRSMSH